MKILFSIVSVVSIEEKCINILVNSARKYFLNNHDIEFVVFTDVNDCPIIDNVRYIKIDNSHTNVITYYQFQKILSLNYIDLTQYDYIFVCDNDSVFVNEVTDDDFDNFEPEICLLTHFGHKEFGSLELKPIKMDGNLQNWTNVIKLDNINISPTMGNFWGGKTETIQKLLLFSNDLWNKYKNHNYDGIGFFSKHSEEVTLIKFIDFFKIKEKRLTSSLNYDINSFLTDFKGFGNLSDNLHRFKLIHDTKYFIKLFEKIL